MLDCITAAATALTALFAWLTYRIVKRQDEAAWPTITATETGDTRNDHLHCAISIDPPHHKSYVLQDAVVLFPDDARISAPGDKPDWLRSIELPRSSSTGVLVSASRGETVTLNVTVRLKSSLNVTRRLTAIIKMHD